LRPRPAHVSFRLSGLRYLGATGPRRLPSGTPKLPNWGSFASRASRSCRAYVTLDSSAASTLSRSMARRPMDSDFSFISFPSRGVVSKLIGSLCRLTREGKNDRESPPLRGEAGALW
jgi:hypothetical protein